MKIVVDDYNVTLYSVVEKKLKTLSQRKKNMKQIVIQAALEKINETLATWASEMAARDNISDCEVREGCVGELTGPAIFEALAKKEDCSLRTLGDNCNWDLTSYAAGIKLAAYAALVEMSEEFQRDEVTFDECFEAAEKAANSVRTKPNTKRKI